MAESNLNLTFGDYLAEVGSFLGWGRGLDKGDRDWGTRKTAQLVEITKSGLRKKYFPSLPPPLLTYEWSYLRIFHTAILTDGASSLLLPDDFGGFEGQVYVSNSSDSMLVPVRVGDEAQVVYAQSQQPDTTGAPQLISEGRLKGTNSQRSERTRLKVWPEADQDYTLKFVYHVLPEALTESHPYNYGGAAHAETFKYACLSVAEIDLDGKQNGPHEQAFQRALLASIGRDRLRKPQYFGKNRDHSDPYDRSDQRTHGFSYTTVNGVLY